LVQKQKQTRNESQFIVWSGSKEDKVKKKRRKKTDCSWRRDLCVSNSSFFSLISCRAFTVLCSYSRILATRIFLQKSKKSHKGKKRRRKKKKRFPSLALGLFDGVYLAQKEKKKE